MNITKPNQLFPLSQHKRRPPVPTPRRCPPQPLPRNRQVPPSTTSQKAQPGCVIPSTSLPPKDAILIPHGLTRVLMHGKGTRMRAGPSRPPMVTTRILWTLGRKRHLRREAENLVGFSRRAFSTKGAKLTCRMERWLTPFQSRSLTRKPLLEHISRTHSGGERRSVVQVVILDIQETIKFFERFLVNNRLSLSLSTSLPRCTSEYSGQRSPP